MLVDLVRTTTRDGLRLDGCFQAAPGATGSSLDLDAICLVHGSGSNFYGSTLFDDLAVALLARGCAVLRINTRGHDGISVAAHFQGGGQRLGAAYEIVDDCRHDLTAWIDWLAQRARPRVGLLGHSLGAVKCLYALAHEPKMAATCVMALSPPRLSYAWFWTSPEGPQFLEDFSRAERQVEAGLGSAPMEVRVPLPMVMAAGAYVEKYGPDERYNFLGFIKRVPCPVLITLGEQEVEGNLAFRGLPAELVALPTSQGRLDVETIPGADHFYSGRREELIACVLNWLGAVLIAPQP